MEFTAIILAAGKGTRMKSSLPKPLHRVGGHPMLGWSIDAARAAGATRTVAVLAPESAEIQTWLGDTGVAIQEDQLGTGSAVAAARDAVGWDDGIAIVMFADTPLVRADSISALVGKVADGAAIAVAAFEPADPTGYGRLVQGPGGDIECIVEHREATDAQQRIGLCNGGIMAVKTPLLFDLLDQVTNDNAKGEYYLTDIVALASGSGHRVAHMVIDETDILGVNDRVDLAAAEAALQSRLRTTAMQAGVTMIAPETVFIAADAIIEPDVIIEPHVVIGSGCHIGEGSIIRAFSHLEGTRLGACCIIGPYARLRPGTEAGDGVKVGNFVEIKKTTLGAGAKANHLTYLGDATIGAEANIGAGTITCNYDGFGKYETLIGEGAFIGSNTALVAPVTIGARAIIGAGSTITRDVGPDSIAVERAHTSEREGAATKFRETRESKTKSGKTDQTKTDQTKTKPRS
ncbi:MAG: bifunctional N-acetylglucosamine-1-phosphate uridyltransferase/glucosamine-1-phosphate acetyltransferase [SAR116 cluster bacterium]|nr:bifunctional N-acetylglucosamine-1-phosphate uridyltransferase/glucosamine-1-phosphate acetyltransferase [SAR116 cluster bacterium]RPG99921.1 MAG: bifunctional UDP-N-acetylglucosamine diphosphorylase/glucosamine-1-phosphate N-acetyltransferase GlmU [Candidatus Puniceispirillum sp. TMED176]|tara:strand:- start:7739 stop:9121 length:1383 start_codon:yes stop_codon:yes gene_type:complete